MKSPELPKTAVGKLMYLLEGMETFLHPRVADALKKAVWDARTEMAQEAKDQVFSKEMQALQPELERFREVMERFGRADRRMLWYMRPVILKIIELYAKPVL